MIKLKHLMVAPLLAMFAVMAPVGCSMETGDATEPGSEDTSTESTDEGSSSESVAAASPKWKFFNADSCGEWYCGSCACEPTKRCKEAVPTNKPCPKRGDVCAKISGNGVSISYYECR